MAILLHCLFHFASIAVCLRHISFFLLGEKTDSRFFIHLLHWCVRRWGSGRGSGDSGRGSGDSARGVETGQRQWGLCVGVGTRTVWGLGGGVGSVGATERVEAWGRDGGVGTWAEAWGQNRGVGTRAEVWEGMEVWGLDGGMGIRVEASGQDGGYFFFVYCGFLAFGLCLFL